MAARVKGRMPMRWIIAATLLLASALALGWWATRDAQRDPSQPVGGELSLPSTRGAFSLEQLDDNQRALVFFGYTYCPDVCPLTLSVVRQALTRLPTEQAARVVPVLISVDPARDSLARLEEYLAFFGEDFIGARPSEAALADIARRYGVVWRRHQGDDSDDNGSINNYSVDHSASLLLVDRHGEIRRRVLYARTPAPLLEALRAELDAERDTG
ncbi:SCO family protein [Onishia taeanensis]